MGTSTNGVISFGVVCEDEVEVPWELEKYDYDIKNWWMEVNGFEDIHSPFTDEGEYAKGWSEKDHRFDEYYAHRKRWIEENPVPVQPENYCSNQCPMWAIVVPEVGFISLRGYPTEFSPADLVVTDEQVKSLNDFLVKYEIEHIDEPRWILTSYWG